MHMPLHLYELTKSFLQITTHKNFTEVTYTFILLEIVTHIQLAFALGT